MESRFGLGKIGIKDIAEATGGRTDISGEPGTVLVTKICTDSREASGGSVFCAIKGEKTDGHDYVNIALRNGCECVICEHVPQDIKGANCTFIVVDDTVDAVNRLASWYIRKTNVKVIAVTGSVGKTSTKELIYSVVSTSFRTHKSKANHNNKLGMSMSVFDIGKQDEYSVLEMGMSSMGEISELSCTARPTIGVITNIGTSHIENLGSRKNICSAKLEILDGMTEGSTLLLNGDEPLLRDVVSEHCKDIRYFGLSNNSSEFRALNVRMDENGTLFDAIIGGKVLINVKTQMIGRHFVYDALVAVAVGTVLGIDERDIKSGLEGYVSESMRQDIYKAGDITVIDDEYNASPESMRASLDVLAYLAESKGTNACALLGDMLELGDYSSYLHDKIGKYVADKKIAKLFCYGPMAQVIAEAAITGGVRAENVFVTDGRDPEYMANMVIGALSPGDILLVKGSRGMKLEEVLGIIKKKI